MDSALPPFILILSAKTQQRAEGRTPSFSRVKVADIFHRLVSTLPGLPFLSSLLAFRQVLEGGPTLPSPPADATSLSPNGAMRARVLQAGGLLQVQQPSQASDLPQGPLSVFSAKNHWRLVGPIHLSRGEGGFGFTLRGDSPVLIAAVVPGGRAAVSPPHRGGREGGTTQRWRGAVGLSPSAAGGRPEGR